MLEPDVSAAVDVRRIVAADKKVLTAEFVLILACILAVSLKFNHAG